MNGIFPFHHSFTPTLRVVARVAWLFQRMLPLDLISLVELWGAQVPMRGAGSPVAPDALVVLLFAHAIKWPGAVRSFVAALPRLDKGSRLTGRAIVDAIRATLVWVESKQLSRCTRG